MGSSSSALSRQKASASVTKSSTTESLVLVGEPTPVAMLGNNIDNEFAFICLPYQCLRLIASHLSSDDLLSLCQTSPDNCRLFGAEVFWNFAANSNGQQQRSNINYESLNLALERKLCLPVESLNNGTYLPSLEDSDSYSGRVVYLHDLNCRSGAIVSGTSSNAQGNKLCIHDYVSGLPRGTYQVTLRAKLGPNWRLQGVTEVALIPDQLSRADCSSLLRARIPERKWRNLAFRHGFERWFCIRLGRLTLPHSSGVRVQILNSRVSKTQLKEGVYLDYIELTPLSCPLADFIGYRRLRRLRNSDVDAQGEACQLL